MLMADASRRFDYSSGQTEMKPSQVFSQLRSLRSIYEKKAKSQSNDGLFIMTRSNRHYDGTKTAQADISRYDLGDSENE
jgi:hypothetical protein